MQFQIRERTWADTYYTEIHVATNDPFVGAVVAFHEW